mmetsp:Transcript_7014/g.11563  ORF Transcript_7014/g.11563 Transcript_7014/m.11563 type:complete len:324 (-) Transcript_7014:400-1371(-)|eukprot:CAMPEP_0197026838 /NCGR_PEP_ID=MMETSP1384-20130603/6852_1 /TAXON_ID=29189 /ORGANISM="Ammonia sp." /LENGTH=323 /DNA_ID=CAMNT_0042455583 /DNA_START=118 /DNA_END=1089 /DNA_ORIENTATION=+
MPKRANTNENEDDDEEYRDPENKWEGFHFTRLTCISILTFIIMIVALILDNLSTWGKERPCSWEEWQYGFCNQASWDPDNRPTCTGQGQCGWRTGVTKWISPAEARQGIAPNGYCPACTDANYCVGGSVGDSSWTSEYNFADLCKDKDDEACMAMDGGNVYIAFTLFALIFNCFILCIIAPLYCRDTSIFPCEVCNEKTHYILGFLYACTWICNLIPVAVWFIAADGGMCDNSDPNHQDAFTSDTTNYPGYSMGGLMICIIANIVGCGAVCCCWGDNRHYGDERDQAKIDRQREKEMYKQQQQQEAEMQQQNAGQQNMTYSYN